MKNAVHQQEKVASHEASHCTIHFYYGHPIQEVAVTEDGGYCKVAAEWRERPTSDRFAELANSEALLQLAVACCAGRYGTARYNGGQKDYGWKKSEDRQEALNCCLALAEGDEIGAELLLAYAMRRAERLVEEQWAQIQRLTMALLDKENGRLTAQEIAKVLAVS